MAKQTSPQAQSRRNAVALLQAAREAGWLHTRVSIKPDGTTVVDASVAAPESDDDFLNTDLRMGQ